ncbi:MAG: hypothetical protein AMXMBFR33_49770 [Candidatus Xenobia bacterium]
MGKRAARFFEEAERQESVVYVPAALLWEVSLLARVGKVELGRSVRAFFEALFSNPAYQPFELTPEQVFMADEARPNDDPFDGLICAAARFLKLPLLSRDRQIADWGIVQVIW